MASSCVLIVSRFSIELIVQFNSVSSTEQKVAEIMHCMTQHVDVHKTVMYTVH